MPFDRSRYPDNWEEIRKKVLLRAGGHTDDPRVGALCEWCGVRNYSVGYWDADNDEFVVEAEWNDYRSARGHADWLNETGVGEKKHCNCFNGCACLRS